jgi:hypothetical protein
MMLLPVIISLLAAAPGFQKPDFITSHTGQFIVHGEGPATPPPVVLGNDQAQTIDLEPQLAAMSAERIKRSILQIFRINDQYRDKIHLVLLDRAFRDQPIGMVATSFADGWKYEIITPARVESVKFIKAIVQAVLLEFANRNHRRGAELPSWLVEGLTQEIIADILPTAVLQTEPWVALQNNLWVLKDRKQSSREIVGVDQLKAAREFFKTNSCLTINQLSFGKVDWSNRDEARLYQASAQLFVHELLKFPNGPRLMAGFVASLPNTLNWQTIFLGVYRQHFARLLDVEKWWALVWLDFKNRESREVWPIDVSAHKLRAGLLTSIEVTAFTNSLPQRQEVGLPVVLEKADFSVQRQILGQKLQQLYFLSYTLAPEVAVIAGKYRSSIQEYLQKRAADVQPGLKMDPETRLQIMTKEAARTFTALDGQLQALEGVHVDQPAVAIRESSGKRSKNTR